MDTAELFEEIRSLLNEPQNATVANPWQYQNADLVPQVRSALRHLRAVGVAIDATMSNGGTLSEDVDEAHGVLIAYFVAYRILTGDLMQRLLEGELGTYFRAGPDVLDTKETAKHFGGIAQKYHEQFQAYLTMVLSQADTGGSSVFGDPVSYGDLGDEVE